MLATDYAADGVVKVDGGVAYEGFYVAESNRMTLEFCLPAPRKTNLLVLGERIESGERVTAFTVDGVRGGEMVRLAEGTSVGYFRAVPLPECDYDCLRISLEGAAEPILRTVSLHYMAEVADEPVTDTTGMNLMDFSGAKLEYADEDCTVVGAFGGIYPFNFVCFKLSGAGSYELYRFDGTRYRLICAGEVGENGSARLFLDQIEEGSYQVMLKASRPIARSAGLRVCLKKGDKK